MLGIVKKIVDSNFLKRSKIQILIKKKKSDQGADSARKFKLW